MKSALLAISAAVLVNAVNVTIDLTQQHPISPLIYGYNQNHEDSTHDEMNLASRRLGGNRMSTHNWEENVDNSGSDANNSNWVQILTTIVGADWNAQDTAGASMRKFHQDNLNNGLTSIITVPILGWVAADKDRTVTTSPSGADSLRWCQLAYEKGSEFTLTPDTTDRFVYLDESVNYLVQTFGDATTETGVKYISLGNEPGLWNHTHGLLQEQPLGAVEYAQKVISAAKAVKAVDPKVKLIAGEFAGINIYNLKNAPDWSSVKGNYFWYIDYLLDELKKASEEVGYPLIDVIAIHNYPQHKVDDQGNFSKEGTVVKDSKSTTDMIRKTRMDFPRSMWDTTYIEPSWLTGSYLNGESNAILVRLQKSIDTYFPGLEMMIGEFDYGFDADISHGIALADLLGVLGNRGVHIATRWDLENGNEGTYTKAAYKLFRNYDGTKSTFGDIALDIDFDNRDSASMWASLNSETGNLHLIALNKSLSSAQDFSLSVPSAGKLTLLSTHGFDATSSTSTERIVAETSEVDATTFSLPALSAYHLIFSVENPVSVKLQKTSAAAPLSVSIKKDVLILPNFTEESTVSLFTLSGRQLFQEKSFGGQIPLSLSNGMYVVTLNSATMETVSQRVLVK